jgi:predicted helicase
MVKLVSKNLGLAFSSEKEPSLDYFSPIDVLDYVYSVLHSLTYRKKYKDFLKIDFPIVPCARRIKAFWQLVNLGGQIRQLHLLESQSIENLNPQFLGNITRRVDFIKFDSGKVHINNSDFFDGVPETAWNFYIGGYQPAQKWLKDRKGRILSDEEIAHYQKIIVALTETDRIMKEIDAVIDKHGGWDKVFVTAPVSEKTD